MKKKLLVAITSSEGQIPNRKTGYWLGEVTHFYQIAVEAGFEVDFASPLGGAPPLDVKSLSRFDAVSKAFLKDAGATRQMEQTIRAAAVAPADYAAIYYAGGHGAMWDFPHDADLASSAAAIYENGGIVSSVCHGAAGLLNIRLSNGRHLIEGKTLTGFTNLEERLVGLTGVVPYLLEDELARKAQFRKTLPFLSRVVVSDRLVTGQNPASSKATAKAVVRLLQQTES
jgi:putative intracellular protease/amidase